MENQRKPQCGVNPNEDPPITPTPDVNPEPAEPMEAGRADFIALRTSRGKDVGNLLVYHKEGETITARITGLYRDGTGVYYRLAPPPGHSGKFWRRKADTPGDVILQDTSPEAVKTRKRFLLNCRNQLIRMRTDKEKIFAEAVADLRKLEAKMREMQKAMECARSRVNELREQLARVNPNET